MKISKVDLINQVAKEHNLSKAESKRIVDSIVNSIMTSVAKGNSVTIVGFGKFEAVKRNKRLGHNPRTGEEITIPAKVVPVFKAGKNFKESVK